MRELFSRIAGAVAGGASAWLASYGMDVPPEAIISICVGVYGVVHKLIDRKVNPADTAKGAKEAAPVTEGRQPLGRTL